MRSCRCAESTGPRARAQAAHRVEVLPLNDGKNLTWIDFFIALIELRCDLSYGSIVRTQEGSIRMMGLGRVSADGSPAGDRRLAGRAAFARVTRSDTSFIDLVHRSRQQAGRSQAEADS